MFISPSLPSLPIYFLWLQKRVLKNEMNVSRKLRNLESNSERMEPGCGSGSNSHCCGCSLYGQKASTQDVNQYYSSNKLSSVSKFINAIFVCYYLSQAIVLLLQGFIRGVPLRLLFFQESFVEIQPLGTDVRDSYSICVIL